MLYDCIPVHNFHYRLDAYDQISMGHAIADVHPAPTMSPPSIVYVMISVVHASDSLSSLHNVSSTLVAFLT